MAGSISEEPHHAASGTHSPHAEVQPQRQRDQRAQRVHYDRLSEPRDRPRLDAALRVLRRSSRTGQAIVLLEIRMSGLPYCRSQSRQGIYRTDTDGGWLSHECGLDLRVAQGSAGAAAGIDGAQAADERRRCSRPHGVSDEPERLDQTGGQKMNRAFILIALIVLAGCSRKQQAAAPAKAIAFGSAIVESSGGKQIAPAGTLLPQPVVIQVNDEQGNGVSNTAVEFSGPHGVV